MKLWDALKNFAIRLYLGLNPVQRAALDDVEKIWFPRGPIPGAHRPPPMPKIAPPRLAWSPMLTLGFRPAPVRCDSCNCPPIVKPGCHHRHKTPRFFVGTGAEQPIGIVRKCTFEADARGGPTLRITIEPCGDFASGEIKAYKEPTPPIVAPVFQYGPNDAAEGVDVLTVRLDPPPEVGEIRGYFHPFDVPSTIGVYARLYAVAGEDQEFFCHWNGYRWSIGFAKLDAARVLGPYAAASDDQFRLWRDVTLEDAYAGV